MQSNFRANEKPPEPKEDLLIFKKTREMIQYGNACLYHAQFPKRYRVGNSIGAQIEKSMYEILDLLTDAAAKEKKKTTLTQADAKIKFLRQLLLIVADPKFDPKTVVLPLEKQRKWSEKLEEMGRILGSWLNKLK